MHRTISKLLGYEQPADLMPLKISFEMTTPLLLAHPFIHLDGLILHLLYRDLLGDDYYCLPSKEPLDFSQYVRAPIAQTVDVYHASVSFFDTDQKFATTIYKRFCTEYLDLLKSKMKKVRRGSGHFRDYMMRMIYIPARSIYFYTCANRAELERLLGHVTDLGKKAAYGFGKVRTLKIEEIEEDYGIVKEGVAMRPIPVTMLRDAEIKMMLAYKPPYWNKRNVALCAYPTTGIKMK